MRHKYTNLFYSFLRKETFAYGVLTIHCSEARSTASPQCVCATLRGMTFPLHILRDGLTGASGLNLEVF